MINQCTLNHSNYNSSRKIDDISRIFCTNLEEKVADVNSIMHINVYSILQDKTFQLLSAIIIGCLQALVD